MLLMGQQGQARKEGVSWANYQNMGSERTRLGGGEGIDTREMGGGEEAGA